MVMQSVRQCRVSMRSVAALAPLGLIPLSAWAYGGTRDETVLVCAISACIAACITAVFYSKDFWVVRLPLIFSGLILAMGWGMALFPQMEYRLDWSRMVPLERAFPHWVPGTIDQTASFQEMIVITALLAVLASLIAIFQSFKGVWLAVIVTGCTSVSLLGYGIVQKLAGAPGIFWESYRPPGTFFATWFYHGNAAAFMHMVFPYLLAGAFVSTTKAMRGLFFAAILITLGAAWMNVSKAGLPLIGVGSIAFAGGLLWLRGREAFTPLRLRWMLGAVAGIIVLAISAPVLSPSTQRWQELPIHLKADYPRFLIADITMRKMVPESGVFGFGPGTWRLAMPFFSHDLGDRAEGIWQHAHNDYLETLVEWGWVGFLMWVAIFAGGCYRGVRSILTLGHRPDMAVVSLAALCSLLTTAIHAGFDFPFQIFSLQMIAVMSLAIVWTTPQREEAA